MERSRHLPAASWRAPSSNRSLPRPCRTPESKKLRVGIQSPRAESSQRPTLEGAARETGSPVCGQPEPRRKSAGDYCIHPSPPPLCESTPEQSTSAIGRGQHRFSEPVFQQPGTTTPSTGHHSIASAIKTSSKRSIETAKPSAGQSTIATTQSPPSDSTFSSTKPQFGSACHPSRLPSAGQEQPATGSTIAECISAVRQCSPMEQHEEHTSTQQPLNHVSRSAQSGTLAPSRRSRSC